MRSRSWLSGGSCGRNVEKRTSTIRRAQQTSSIQVLPAYCPPRTQVLIDPPYHEETAQYGNTPSSFNQPPFDPTVGAYPYASQTQVSGTDELPLGYTEPFIGAQLAQVPSRTSFHGQPPLSGKAAAMQQAQTPEEPAIYHSDSGVRFTPAGPSSSDSAPGPAPPPPPTVLSDDIPPLYTEH